MFALPFQAQVAELVDLPAGRQARWFSNALLLALGN
jgi:hypothetical protein